MNEKHLAVVTYDRAIIRQALHLYLWRRLGPLFLVLLPALGVISFGIL